jgi:hypothetical protein
MACGSEPTDLESSASPRGASLIAPAPAEIAGADSTHMVLKTEAGVVVGTAAYMSPEQSRGQEVDARTDIWSLGVLLYEMVAGRSPFTAPSGTDVLAAILEREPALVARFEPDAPAEVQRILTKTLRKDCSLRYQTVQDLLLNLQALRDDVHAHARFGSAPDTPIATEGARARRPAHRCRCRAGRRIPARAREKALTRPAVNRGSARTSAYRRSTVSAKYIGTDGSADATAARAPAATTCGGYAVRITVYMPRW